MLKMLLVFFHHQCCILKINRRQRFHFLQMDVISRPEKSITNLIYLLDRQKYIYLTRCNSLAFYRNIPYKQLLNTPSHYFKSESETKIFLLSGISFKFLNGHFRNVYFFNSSLVCVRACDGYMKLTQRLMPFFVFLLKLISLVVFLMFII